ncbi:hypothetical protein EDI_134180 [Entamoeba dispar SAW760]|uniref:Uncharacterized protein n=1 Tax=Entamoeba dispar (strain ATCC PRA-260 / SAW760) TaxID=370354 RepID=B0EKG5_ENTDS|nr:uncharacterized protein EDI_134180 [Entamoeba dispar SAW760]EDR25003.1 hypothetical protein EDI_134180 [Entamoeba dispar SAW760]|eukprot:EDR25003.1 hypothetical protein EDI_134180 [Entamoeba dispar SAW760]
MSRTASCKQQNYKTIEVLNVNKVISIHKKAKDDSESIQNYMNQLKKLRSKRRTQSWSPIQSPKETSIQVGDQQFEDRYDLLNYCMNTNTEPTTMSATLTNKSPINV